MFVAGIVIGYAVFSRPVLQPGQMMDNSQFRQQLMQDPAFMQQMMADQNFQNQMLMHMGQNPQFRQQMMNGMMNDPTLRQQTMDQMMNNPQFMQQWMENPRLQQDYVYPNMIQNWMMGPGMGQATMGGMMGPATDPSTVPAVQTDKVVIPPDAWNRRTLQPYQPLHIEVSQGTTVTWTNNDSVVHTVTGTNNEFDSNLIYKDNSWSFKFDSAGQYDYYCTIHPWMQGSVKVN
ncbi:MAG: hypothetical protein DA330_05295 [Nitrososphaera sp.]|nr:hypothetical protein [Nitrososphaera sp.]